MSEEIADEEDAHLSHAVITEVLQKAYLRWKAIQKAKRLVDSGWLNEKVEKITYDPRLMNLIEGLLAGKSIETIAEDVQIITVLIAAVSIAVVFFLMVSLMIYQDRNTPTEAEAIMEVMNELNERELMMTDILSFRSYLNYGFDWEREITITAYDDKSNKIHFVTAIVDTEGIEVLVIDEEEVIKRSTEKKWWMN